MIPKGSGPWGSHPWFHFGAATGHGCLGLGCAAL